MKKRRKRIDMPGVEGSPEDHMVRRTDLDVPHPGMEPFDSQPTKDHPDRQAQKPPGADRNP